MNPFTDESRDARLHLNIAGLCDTLRAPASIHQLVMRVKPAGIGVGDWLLFAGVSDAISVLNVNRDFRGIQSLLDTLFGPLVPSGTTSAERHKRTP